MPTDFCTCGEGFDSETEARVHVKERRKSEESDKNHEYTDKAPKYSRYSQ